jgi:hypothetical protein
MAYKLLDVAQAHWQRLDGAHLLPLVRAGIVFADGVDPEGRAGKPKARAAWGPQCHCIGSLKARDHLV